MVNRKSNLLIILASLLFMVVIALFLFFFLLSNSARFNRKVEKADSFFTSSNIEEARILYAEALQLCPDEGYPLNQMSKIDSMLALQSLVRQYKLKLTEADSLFVMKNYEVAQTKYLEAAQDNPDDPYPFEQINQIELILAEISQNQPDISANYHIVVGVFENKTNTENMLQILKEKGKNSLIIPRQEFGMQAVTYGSYSSIHEAYNMLGKVRQEISPDAWVIYFRQSNL